MKRNYVKLVSHVRGVALLSRNHIITRSAPFPLAVPIQQPTIAAMFSHVVIFWTDPAQANAADELIAGAEKFLKPIPGVTQFHVGKMVGSHRPVVDQTYQVALNIIFPDKKAQDDYQVHPLHVEFVEKYVRRVVKKVLVYDFE